MVAEPFKLSVGFGRRRFRLRNVFCTCFFKICMFASVDQVPWPESETITLQSQASSRPTAKVMGFRRRRLGFGFKSFDFGGEANAKLR